MMMMMMMMNYISGLMTTQFVTIDHNTTAGETAKMYFGKYSFSNDVKINLEIAMIQLFTH